ncbi:MAG: hypothetical protein WBB82_17135 [Limnothrix sp.]
MSNSQISSIQRKREKRKRELQQRRSQFKHQWELYQAKQQATQMGLTSAQTSLGTDDVQADKVLEAMQRIWSRRGTFAPANLANIFIQQTDDITYKAYKQALVQYLWTAIADQHGLEPLKHRIEETLGQLWPEQGNSIINARLKLRTCNRLISLLTTQGLPHPSPMFTLLAVQEQYDVFGLMLLRLMLLSRPSYQCFADAIKALIDYYAQLNNPKSQWIVSFLEMFQLNIREYLDRDFDQKNKFTPHHRDQKTQ